MVCNYVCVSSVTSSLKLDLSDCHTFALEGLLHF